MSGDVSKIQGPSGAPESSGKKDTSSADRERFQIMMREQASQVGAVDPDEQKKRKRQEEMEEEAKVAIKAALDTKTTTLPSEPAPFLVTQSPAHTELLGMGSSKVSGSPPPGPVSVHADTPFSEEMLQIPTSPTQPISSPPSYTSSSAPSEISSAQSAGASTTSQQNKKKRPDLQSVPAEAAAFKKQMTPQEKMFKEQEVKGTAPLQVPPSSFQGAIPPKRTEEEIAPLQAAPSSFQGAIPPKGVEEETSPFSSQGAISPKGVEEETPQKGPIPLQGAGSTDASGGRVSGGATTGKSSFPIQPLTTALPGSSSEPEPPEVFHAQNAYIKLPPEAQELFNRMVGVMTVMQLSGIRETSFILNMPQFASSVFFGTRIIIQEFSTAPQMFNIQFNGTPQAVSLFQKNTAGLMAAFQSSHYNFRIHRLETHYLTDDEDKGDSEE